VINTPGHSEEHVSFLHQETGRLFVGDSLGMHLGENSYVPPFMPANWDLEAFYDTIRKLKQIDFNQLCFAHFGCISKEKSRNFLDFAQEQTNLWWRIFDTADEEGMVRNYDFLTERILSDSNLILPDIELLSAKLRIGLKLLNGVRRIRGKDPLPAARVLMHDYVVPWLSRGYRIYKKNSQE
jgi:glyoxylase-like metal-dependent hydrolase (beta-lactamase superfamily II)